MEKKLILASNSPRRREMLKKSGYEFTAVKSDYEEIKDALDPIEMVKKFSLGKAQDVFNKYKDKNSVIVLGADTVVWFEGEILGKPKDSKDAFNTLKRLSGNTHTVYTGFTVLSGDFSFTGYDESTVTFNCLSDEMIRKYVDTGKPLDKAGSYGIQDGFPIVKSYTGSLNNIIGLPIEKIEKFLK